VSMEIVPTIDSRGHLRDVIVCPHCDGLFKARHLRPNEYARCPDCLESIQGQRGPSPQLVLCAALTGLILLVIAICFPVLTASVGGLTTEVNILSASKSFGSDWFIVAAWALAIVTFVVPMVQVSVLSWVLAFALARRRAPGFSGLLGFLQMLRRWAMVEVFLLGAIVVITKIGGWVSITFGPGLWAVAVFTGLLATVHRFDSASLWEQYDS
jgi:paraquat-inducible protein A